MQDRLDESELRQALAESIFSETLFCAYEDALDFEAAHEDDDHDENEEGNNGYA